MTGGGGRSGASRARRRNVVWVVCWKVVCCLSESGTIALSGNGTVWRGRFGQGSVLRTRAGPGHARAPGRLAPLRRIPVQADHAAVAAGPLADDVQGRQFVQRRGDVLARHRAAQRGQLGCGQVVLLFAVAFGLAQYRQQHAQGRQLERERGDGVVQRVRDADMAGPLRLGRGRRMGVQGITYLLGSESDAWTRAWVAPPRAALGAADCGRRE